MNSPLHKNMCLQSLFEKFYNEHAKNLHDFLYYKFGSFLNPQDKMQEAFIKLWQNCKKINPDKAKSFLYTTANNMMLNEVAHQKVVLKHRQIKPKHHTNESPEFLMEEKQYLEKLEQALANLTENERIVFLMNRTEGKRYKEISALLDITVSAVEKRMYSALKKIRAEIKEI